MRNRPIRSLTAALASVALAAGLASYPVAAQDAENTQDRALIDATSTTTIEDSPTVEDGAPLDAVHVTRDGDVDIIDVEDPDGSAWGFGAKASDEDIFALKRIGDGEIEEILKFTADGKDLDPEFYGYVNDDEGGFIAFDLDALDTIPPELLEIEVRTSEEASYEIAESDEVPIARELSSSGYGKTDRTQATVNPNGIGQARAAQQSNSARRVSTGSMDYTQVRNGTPPRGQLRVPITGRRTQQNLYLTEIVIRHNNQSANYGISGPIVIKKLNGGGRFNGESCTVTGSSIRQVESRPNGAVREVSLDLSGCNLAVWEGDGNSLDIEFTGPSTGAPNNDYTVEVYANTAPNTQPNRFTYPNQRVAVCSGVPATLYPVSGFRIDPAQEFNYELKSVESNVLQLYVNYGNNRTTKPSDVSPRRAAVEYETLSVQGKSAQGHFRSTLDEFGTVDPLYRTEPLANTLCAIVTLDANVELVDSAGNNKVNIGEYLRIVPEQATSETPIRTPDRQNVSPGWDQPTKRNPVLEEKCGQNIAIVLDASNSIIQENGIDAMADSALRIIGSLEGTGSSVGLYNFGSSSPRFESGQVPSSSLNDPESAKRVREGVEAYRNGLKNVNVNQTRFTGSTNWEAALESIRSYNESHEQATYDAVYFITDGFPTYSNAGPGKTGGAEDASAGMVHVSDVTRAMTVADQVKAQGTAIQPILVNIDPEFREPVARDTTVALSQWHDYYEANKRFPGDTFIIWGELGTFVGNTLANKAIDFYQMRQFMTLARGYGDLLASEITPQPEPDRTRKVKNGQAELDYHDWNTWAVGSKTAKEMGNTIGDGNAVVVKNFGDLNSVLANLALKNCASTVSLSKSIYDSLGTPVAANPKLDGWRFQASTPELNLVEGKNLTNQVEQITDDKGGLTFDLDLKVPDKIVPVTIKEVAQEGFALFPREGKNAVCRVSSIDKPDTSEIQVVNLDQGFTINAMSGQIITCSVANQEKPKEPEPKAQLRIAKVSHDINAAGNLTQGAPLEGAKFKLERITEQGLAPVELKQGGETNLLEAADLPLGRYRLTETQSPSGYALLVQPIEFELTRDTDSKALQLKLAEEGAHVAVKPLLDPKQPDLAVITVANIHQGNLPRTGGAGLGLPVGIGLGIILLGAFTARRQRV